jgi:hypothetical protein
MSDFFSRIAERALSVAPIVKPNLPPMFAPMPLIETSAEVVTPRSARAAEDFPSGRDLSRDYADPAIGDRPAQALAQEHQLSRTVSQRPMFSPLPIDARREPSAVLPETSERKSHDWVREPIVRGPALAATPNLETFSTRDSNAPPTVQVTISRVEVRAVTPPAQTPRAIERKSPPLLSLEEYLRERNGGRR